VTPPGLAAKAAQMLTPLPGPFAAWPGWMQPGGFTPGDPGAGPAPTDQTHGGTMPASQQSITRPTGAPSSPASDIAAN
jgi:hypothetical protein